MTHESPAEEPPAGPASQLLLEEPPAPEAPLGVPYESARPPSSSFPDTAWADKPFLPMVQAACEHASHDTGRKWLAEGYDEGSWQWVWARTEEFSIPEQGWKLHVSATVRSAEEVLSRALPVLLEHSTAFKLAGSARALATMNNGLSGLSQVGKFITVYPVDDEQAVHLAVALDKATRGLRGPAVPSDRPLSPGSLVHYRYGAFMRRVMQTEEGEHRPAMRDPSGRLVTDNRLPAYTPPDWATDPFQAGGAAEPLPERTPLIAGRYLTLKLMSDTPRGSVWAAIDVLARRKCMVKRAKRDGAMGLDGMDSSDRLRNEASALERLGPDPHFPEVYAQLEENGDLYLVMEDVFGDTVYQYVRELSRQGRLLPMEKILGWGKEVARMLATIHANGLLYRDLKSTNIIVSPDDGLRLIDFDVVLDVDAPQQLFSPGTLGYLSAQQWDGRAPRVVDDIYSFGALLYFLATAAEPSAFPHHFNLLRRKLSDLNPGVPPAFGDLVARCLQSDPAARFQSMDEVLAVLDAISESEQARTAVGPLLSESAKASGPEERARFLGHARQLAETLSEVGLGAWSGGNRSAHELASRDISVGSSGVVLALAELAQGLGEDRPWEVLAQSARRLRDDPLPEEQPASGLYVGEAGVGAALLRAGQVLGDKELIAEAEQRGAWVDSQPYGSPGLFNGTAGRIRFHVMLWDETGDGRHLEAATRAGDALLELARPAGDDGLGLSWTIPEGYGRHAGRTYLGYSIGAAGMGDCLLDLWEAGREPRFLQAAGAAFHWITGNARPALGDGSGLDWPPEAGEDLQGAFWGHGGAGIGRFLLHAERAGIEGARPLLERAALTAAMGTRWAGPTIGYGLGGPIELLLDLYQAWGNRSYLAQACVLGRILESFGTESDGRRVWPAESPRSISPSFIAGYGGAAFLMLRLALPEQVPHNLARASGTT